MSPPLAYSSPDYVDVAGQRVARAGRWCPRFLGTPDCLVGEHGDGDPACAPPLFGDFDATDSVVGVRSRQTVTSSWCSATCTPFPDPGPLDRAAGCRNRAKGNVHRARAKTEQRRPSPPSGISMSRSGALGTLPAGDHDDQAATIAAGQSALSAIVICPAAAIGHMARVARSNVPRRRGSSSGSPCMPASAALPLARDLAAKQDRTGIADQGVASRPSPRTRRIRGSPGL